ncbi:MAG: divergent polysaccharide deacetylase family protein [Alphaproteobacteria bacterium]|nr:divergent polysaccharide deacetylase family protein [Alphaproteobacteria bacterium]
MPFKSPFSFGSLRTEQLLPLAVGVFVVLCAVTVALIQLFGDPGAASPRRVVSLSPSPASAGVAERVPFSEAAVDSFELGAMGEALPLDEHGQPIPGAAPTGAVAPFPGGDPTAPPGQLRITLVQPTRGTSPVTPLPRAPISGFYEAGALGPIPIIASDGRTAANAYARPFTPQSERPMIAIIVGGLGFNRRATQQAIEDLPQDVTLSFVPYASGLQDWIDTARADGHEVLLEVPMEPFDPEADDTGPQTLQVGISPAENIERLENILSRAAGYFGVTNYQGGRFAANAQAAGPVAQALRRRGLALITTGIGQRTALSSEARRAALPMTAADRVIDSQREAEAIDEQLLTLEALALQNGAAIGAGFAYPVTIDQVGRWSAELSARGYQLAPASAVLRSRAGTL